MRQITDEDIKSLRKERNVGLMEAKKILSFAILREECDKASTVEELRLVIHQLINLVDITR